MENAIRILKDVIFWQIIFSSVIICGFGIYSTQKVETKKVEEIGISFAVPVPQSSVYDIGPIVIDMKEPGSARERVKIVQKVVKAVPKKTCFSKELRGTEMKSFTGRQNLDTGSLDREISSVRICQ